MKSKKGHNQFMVADPLALILRGSLVAVIWLLVWRLVRPNTAALRVVRAALLVACLLLVLAVLRLAGA